MKKLKKEHILLVLVSLAWFLILSGRYSISALLVNIENTLNFGDTEAGIALSAMWLFYGLMQFPSGIFSDIKGRKKSIIIAMTIFSFSYLLIGFSFNYLIFFLSVILLGIGTGGYPTVGISMITDIFKKNRGKALGIQSSAGSFSGVIPIFASLIAAIYDWRLFFFIWAGVSLFAMFMFIRNTWESTKLPDFVSIKERFFDGVSVFKIKKIWLLFFVNLTLAFSWIGYMSFFVVYLVKGKDISTLYASIALAFLATSGLFLKPIIGSLSDKHSKKIIIMLLTFLSASGTLLLVYADNLPIIFLISFLLSFTSGAFPVISSYLMDQWGEKGRAGKLGFYRSLIILFGSPISAYIGYTADRFGGFAFPFLTISMVLFVSCFCMFTSIIIDRYKKRDIF